MPRKLEFDVRESVDQATRVFWDQGYENTSLEDLLKQMQISPGSFYNKFQSKKQLYRICLDHYNATQTARRTDVLFDESSTIQAAARGFFRMVVNEIARPQGPKGCLMTNSLCTEVLSDPELHEYVTGGMRDMGHRIQQRIQLGIDRGELPPDFDASTAADLFISWIQGLNKSAQLGKSARQLQKETDLLLEGLGL
ncbi:MAG: TetR/AcrR family transcriptional regulator [bacterium]|nr:TetR/AcrR family transcriptional regulator [bacterium]